MEAAPKVVDPQFFDDFQTKTRKTHFHFKIFLPQMAQINADFLNREIGGIRDRF